MQDLWPDFTNENNNEENQAVEILREQAKALSKKTAGKVKATFSKVSYNSTPVLALEKLAALLPKEAISEEILEDELKNKQDFNDLYIPTKYKFEIYNSTYRFRVFTLLNNMYFPISFEIDEGILEELSMLQCKNPVEVKSNVELKNLIESVLSSKKVRTIVIQMMKESQ